MVLCTVVIPDGLRPGDAFLVSNAGGQEFTVSVPDGCWGNDMLDIDLPAEEPPVKELVTSSMSVKTERVQVTVPEGVRTGDAFTVQTAWGGEFEVHVPPRIRAGDTLEVELPVGPEEQPVECTAEQPAATAASEPASTYVVGDRVKVQRSNGSWSPADIIEYDEPSDTYTAKLLATGQLKYMLTDNEVMPLEYQAEVAGEHFVGRRVQVPFIGAVSKDEVMGDIRSYDAVTCTYVVAMDNGTVKRGVQAEAIKVREKKSRPPDGTPSKALAAWILTRHE